MRGFWSVMSVMAMSVALAAALDSRAAGDDSRSQRQDATGEAAGAGQQEPEVAMSAAVKLCLDWLADEDPAMRLVGCDLLAEMGDGGKTAVPALIEAARHDGDQAVREAAQDALFKIDRILIHAEEEQGAAENDEPTLVGTWVARGTIEGVACVNEVRFYKDGTLRSVCDTDEGVRVWDDQGQYACQGGLLFLSFADEEVQKAHIEWNGPNQFVYVTEDSRRVYDRQPSADVR